MSILIHLTSPFSWTDREITGKQIVDTYAPRKNYFPETKANLGENPVRYEIRKRLIEAEQAGEITYENSIEIDAIKERIKKISWNNLSPFYTSLYPDVIFCPIIYKNNLRV